MLRKFLIVTAAVATAGVLAAAPALVAPQALAATPKCKNKAKNMSPAPTSSRPRRSAKKLAMTVLPRSEVSKAKPRISAGVGGRA